MWFAVLAVALVLVIASSATFLATALNRRQANVILMAERQIRDRLSARASSDLQTLIDAVRPREQSFSHAAERLEGLAALIGVPPEKFRESDSLQDLAVAHWAGMTTMSRVDWDSASGGADSLEVFGYELLDFFEKHKNDRALAAALLSRNSEPSSEDDWTDFLMSLTLKEFMAIVA